MSGRCLSRSLRVQVAQTSSNTRIRQRPSSFRRASSSVLVTLRPPDTSDQLLSHLAPEISASSSLDHVKQSRWTDLRSALARNDTPDNRYVVWSAYSNLLHVVGTEAVPLQVHQQVLRSCVPSVTALRVAVTSMLSRGRLPDVPGKYEQRVRAVIQNIQNAGLQPTLDDYNFVLGHFAAVGHYQGCWEVYKEIKRIGYTPTDTTFAYCFQSIAQRMALPKPKLTRHSLEKVAQDMFSTYMADMREHGVPMNPVTFDLSIRVLKETLDIAGFEQLMRWGYGIDLSNPDRVALEFLDPTRTGADGAPTTPFPFTTTALNTTLEVLGQIGDISKMVVAFEVLTQPLPSANQHFFDSFESDEEDDFGVQVKVGTNAQQTLFAKPNTTTFRIMLRYLCRADNAVLARHYINYARMLDRQVAHHLRIEVMQQLESNPSLEGISSPNLAIEARMLRSVMGEGNKDKNLGLLRWVQSKMPNFIRKCKANLDYYSRLLSNPRLQHPPAEERPPPEDRSPYAQSTRILELDIEKPPLSSPVIEKPFNLARHVDILQDNYTGLVTFSQQLDYIVQRTHERTKERLGRRVWSKKDVFFSDATERQNVSKDRWKKEVNFRPITGSYQHKANPKPWKPQQSDEPVRRRRSDEYLPRGRRQNTPHLSTDFFSS